MGKGGGEGAVVREGVKTRHTFLTPLHTQKTFFTRPYLSPPPPFQVMEDMADIFSKVDKGGEGVCVQVTRGGAERGGARRIWIWVCTLYPINPRHPPPHLSTPQASTLGALEALLEFLSTKEVNIAVAGINIGPVHKKDVMRANVMNERSESWGGREGE